MLTYLHYLKAIVHAIYNLYILVYYLHGSLIHAPVHNYFWENVMRNLLDFDKCWEADIHISTFSQIV